MNRYIDGAIKEGIEKAKILKARIPRARDLGIYFPPLATNATHELDEIIMNFEYLLQDAVYNDLQNLQQKFHSFKQLSGQLAQIENVVIAAISRKNSDDDFVNGLVYSICSEINYPLQAPVASCLSQKYYHIYPYYNLICIPLLESDFLLHIPDIYHELCHPLITLENLKLDPFKEHLGKFNNEVKKYFNSEIKRRDLNQFNNNYYNPLNVWLDSWIENWSTEFFCDLFSVYTLGPAFAWSNIHMCTKMSWNIFRLSQVQRTEHPPDDARMQAMIYGLELINFTEAANEVSVKWDEFKEISAHPKPEAEYGIALPKELIESAAAGCLAATKAIDCVIVDPNSTNKYYRLLNEAWDTFWLNPADFYLYEKQKVKELRAGLVDIYSQH